MIINLRTAKVGINDVRGCCRDLPEACVFDFVSAIKRNGHHIEPNRLTPQAKTFVNNLVYVCKTGSVGDVCGLLYERN